MNIVSDKYNFIYETMTINKKYKKVFYHVDSLMCLEIFKHQIKNRFKILLKSVMNETELYETINNFTNRKQWD